jgi:hypothetical protein
MTEWVNIWRDALLEITNLSFWKKFLESQILKIMKILTQNTPLKIAQIRNLCFPRNSTFK